MLKLIAEVRCVSLEDQGMIGGELLEVLGTTTISCQKLRDRDATIEYPWGMVERASMVSDCREEFFRMGELLLPVLANEYIRFHFVGV